ncbi:MFS domain-containing protein [Mycena kentingensis (nom. inval.)]|nr:MFS domain-containing protein [Mycena kentingensis (nom. inval.)]
MHEPDRIAATMGTTTDAQQPRTLLSQLRNLNPLNSLFTSSANNTNNNTSSTSSLLSTNNVAVLMNKPVFNTSSILLSDDNAAVGSGMAMTITPTPSRPSTPQPHQRPSRSPAVKNIITSLSRAAARSNSLPMRIEVVHTREETEEHLLEGWDVNDAMLKPTIVSQCTALGHDQRVDDEVVSVDGDTPPLTPESLIADGDSDGGLVSPMSQSSELDGMRYVYGYGDAGEEEEDEDISARPHSQEIKEGKKPARPIDYDTLLDDITNDVCVDAPITMPAVAAADDADEWFGLDYALELSTRERRASETPTISTGEHSKSRESWLAIHEGTVHPYYADEEFSLWKDWHRWLDRQDERKRHRRGRAFRMQSKELAWIYVDEMLTMDAIEWQGEVYGRVDRELWDRLEIFQSHRPDAYCPPQRHNRAWHLKRSRSVSSLFELCPRFLEIDRRFDFSGEV